MPFTPYHLGPGLLFGLLLFGYVDLPTFLVASVVIDIEPFSALSLSLNYPVHGYLHTFLGGTIVAFLLALAMSRIRGTVSPLMSFLKLEQKTSFKSIVLASVLGIYFHILLDSPLYSDIRPFYPIEFNPLLGHGMSVGFEIYAFCVLSFLGGAIVYAVRLASARKRT
jgi:membrane-bound metal-dependent hydrolase YbcI (DUF457 family)